MCIAAVPLGTIEALWIGGNAIAVPPGAFSHEKHRRLSRWL
jgi:hypothetical protein